ncbi:TraR/DksA C4-type zinc finger protein [Photobacterium makurazakiensis]|uniref:TraR/DksA C4-type zinc finger protein n=1 Tax=Photobacterium makurazakiensis TaxID=2910234 RepID=UPI003D0B97D1
MADVIDQGCRFEAQFTEMAIANQRARVNGIEQRQSAHECGECGEPIPEKRRETVSGCQYCTPCQELADRGRR